MSSPIGGEGWGSGRGEGRRVGTVFTESDETTSDNSPLKIAYMFSVTGDSTDEIVTYFKYVSILLKSSTLNFVAMNLRPLSAIF